MPPTSPSIGILSLGTAVPLYRIDQALCGQWMALAQGEKRALSRWIGQLYRMSGIETRYSCLPEAQSGDMSSRFRPGQPVEQTPATSERMALYQQCAVPVATEAAQHALAELGPDAADSITHLIVVSCTGFFAPGPDLKLVQNLGLRPTVERTVVGFMGCAAAFNALRLAHHIVRGQPTARVLIVCVELCTLHLQPGDDRISLVIASLFADGAGACVVGTAEGASEDALLLDGFYTGVLPDSEQDMAWRIGDHGFVMGLSPEVPRRVGEVAPAALGTLFAADERPDFWAIHPGGRAIVDHLVTTFALTPEEAAPSYGALRQYGNMSSPTILFVLKEVRQRLRAGLAVPDGVAMAFGPGLVAEMARLRYLPAPARLLEANAQSAAIEAGLLL